MSESNFQEPFSITDGDIRAICSLLNLPEHAFCGVGGCDERDAVLRSMETLDVAACPGSGKTTLLVAKLAILAGKWPYATRGICVLSHTNAARREIETRLGNTPAGRHLLSYPHYIGTIHGFVGTYLGIPWLRSLGYSVRMVDDAIAQAWRLRQLRGNLRRRIAESHRGSSVLTATSPQFDVEVPWSGGNLRPGGEYYECCRDACTRSARNGFFCYDELFVFADDLLDRVPDVAQTIRARFPLLFIDEVQDNSETQSAVLRRIFMEGDGSVVRQRFGDLNQAIYDSDGVAGADIDPFPVNDQVRRRLPSSHRFGQLIADLADPLGLEPCGLEGNGPKCPLESGASEAQHTIFLFGEGQAAEVLPAYGDLLLNTFSDDELRAGTFVAVGQVHIPPAEEKQHKYPHHVGHYWPQYDPQLAKADPRPTTLVQHIVAGISRARTSGEAAHCAEMVAEGLLWLAGQSTHRVRKHRHLIQLLSDEDARSEYETALAALILNPGELTEERWNTQWRATMSRVAGVLRGSSPPDSDQGAFLAWPTASEVTTPEIPASAACGNVYNHRRDNRETSIRLGSIHSVKGETHTAVLVLETFWNGHNLEALLPWLTGESRGAGGGKRQPARLRAHYVAMTRPTHLLCLAMREDSLADDGAKRKAQERGWLIRQV